MSGTINPDSTVAPYQLASQWGQANPLGQMLQTAQGYVGLQQNALALRQNQMMFRARQALGPILQSSIDPATGQLDYNKAFLSLASNPDTSLLANDFLNNAVARQKTQADTAKTQLDTRIAQYGTFQKAAQGLTLLGTSVTSGDVIGTLSTLVGQGVLSKDAALNIAGRLPAQGGPGLASWIKQVAMQTASAKDAMSMVINQFNTGNKNYLVGTNPMTGQTQVVAGATMGMTPAEANKPTSVVVQSGPNAGATMTGPRATTLPTVTPYGGGGDLNITGASPGGAPASGAQVPGGAPQAAPRVPVQATPLPPASGGGAAGVSGQGIPAQPSAGGNSPPGGLVMTALSPQQVAYQTQMGQTAAKTYATLNDQATSAVKATQNLELMRQLSGLYGQGAGIETRAAAARIASALGAPQSFVNRILSGTNQDALGAIQEVQKLAAQTSLDYVKAALGEGGGRVLATEYENFLKTFPSPNMQPSAFTGMISQMQKMLEQKIAERNYYTQWIAQPGNNPVDWDSNWAKLLAKKGIVKLHTPLGQSILNR